MKQQEVSLFLIPLLPPSSQLSLSFQEGLNISLCYAVCSSIYFFLQVVLDFIARTFAGQQSEFIAKDSPRLAVLLSLSPLFAYMGVKSLVRISFLFDLVEAQFLSPAPTDRHTSMCSATRICHSSCRDDFLIRRTDSCWRRGHVLLPAFRRWLLQLLYLLNSLCSCGRRFRRGRRRCGCCHCTYRTVAVLDGRR